jgi:hypothetical protein
MHFRTWLTASCLSLFPWATGGCVERLLTDGFDEFHEDGGPGDACVDDLDCAPGHACFEGTCVGAGEFRVSLSWSATTDLDLHVLTPNGIEISYLAPRHPFAHLDVDDCVAGRCRNPEGPHVENVVFEPHAPPGSYLIWVANFDGRRSAAWSVEVTGSTGGFWTGELPAEQGVQSDPIEISRP